MESDESLEAFIQAVETACAEEENENNDLEEEYSNVRLNKAPKIDTGIFCRFPILMKNSPYEREHNKSPDCKKCQVTKKRLEEKIEKLESTILFQQDQLFELYSHLNARVSSLEQKNSYK